MPRPTPADLRQSQIALWRVPLAIQPILLFFSGLLIIQTVPSLLANLLARIITLPASLPPTMLVRTLSRAPEPLSHIIFDRGLHIAVFGVIFALFLPRLLCFIFARFTPPRRATPIHPRQPRTFRRLQRPLQRLGRWVNALYVLAPIAVMLALAMYMYLTDGPWLQFANVALVSIAWLLITASLTLRIGTGRRCSRCEYRMTTYRGSADLCPECGNPWKRLGGTVYGTRLHRAWLLSGVALLLAAASVWAFVPV